MRWAFAFAALVAFAGVAAAFNDPASPNYDRIGDATMLPMADGGTNAALTADNGAICYSTASALALLASTATAGQPLLSGASAAPTWGGGGTMNMVNGIITNIGNASTDFTTNGTLLFVDGDSTNPSIAFTAVTNTGIRRSSSDIIVSQTAGATRLAVGATASSVTGVVEHPALVTISPAAAATTFAITRNIHAIDCDAGGNTISTITGGTASAVRNLTLYFVDTDCHIADTDDGTADTIDLNETDAVTDNDIDSTDDLVLTLTYNGTLWRQTAPASTN